ncbi:hypothetical protein [Beijerinckia mobilis]|uniref:hypothetical protein n=1 Tax=Beijerinckia mobilis TaxID=231434 RepID=UPI0012EC31AA|nr:hypothetical protein [Beijerinckia mobilis]
MSDSFPTSKTAPDFSALSFQVAKLLRAFGNIRRRRSLSADEYLIFLAIGQLSLASSKAILTVKPTTYHDISVALKIPKETVRRKVARLVDNDLVYITPQGVMLKNVDEWYTLSSALFKQTI